MQLILKDGTVNKTLKDAMIFLNSQLLQYFKNPVGPAAMSSVYFNYI